MSRVQASTVLMLALYGAMAFSMAYASTAPIAPATKQVSDVAPVMAPTRTPTPNPTPTREATPAPRTYKDSERVLFAAYDGAVMVPLAFASYRNGLYDLIQCESKGDPSAVGQAGELGLMQIHPIHRARMQTLNLSFEKESDRIAYAVILWEESDWAHWSCKPYLMAEVERMALPAQVQ